MNATQQATFAKQYKAILAKRKDWHDAKAHIQKLNVWDKNGSHQKAIVKAMDRRDIVFNELVKLLSGNGFEQWQMCRRKLTSLTQCIKLCKNTDRKQKLQYELDHLTL